MIKLTSKICEKCPFKQLEIVTFNKNTVIESCTRCNNNE